MHRQIDALLKAGPLQRDSVASTCGEVQITLAWRGPLTGSRLWAALQDAAPVVVSVSAVGLLLGPAFSAGGAGWVCVISSSVCRLARGGRVQSSDQRNVQDIRTTAPELLLEFIGELDKTVAWNHPVLS